jgi:hypothetical protein
MYHLDNTSGVPEMPEPKTSSLSRPAGLVKARSKAG